jgi:hypothetical protein
MTRSAIASCMVADQCWQPAPPAFAAKAAWFGWISAVVPQKTLRIWRIISTFQRLLRFMSSIFAPLSAHKPVQRYFHATVVFLALDLFLKLLLQEGVPSLLPPLRFTNLFTDTDRHAQQTTTQVKANGWKNVEVVEADACEWTPPEGTATLVTFSYSL